MIMWISVIFILTSLLNAKQTFAMQKSLGVIGWCV